MKLFISPLRKIALMVIAAVMAMAALPFSSASAETLKEPGNPPKATKPGTTFLEAAWARQQRIYERQERRLGEAESFIAKIQGLVDRANAKGWDTTNVQEALGAFSAVIPAAQAAHAPGAAIIEEHAGFNPNGKVVQREEAVNTVKSMREVLQNTRQAMDGTGRALRQAIRELMGSHRQPATTTP